MCVCVGVRGVCVCAGAGEVSADEGRRRNQEITAGYDHSGMLS